MKSVLDEKTKYVAPKIYGRKDVKKGFLLFLSAMEDKANVRNRIHVLLVGKPGTGKSVFIDYLRDFFDASYCDSNTSRIGFVGDASGDFIKKGVLARSDKGIVCVDELGHIEGKEALREAMERGKYKIIKGEFEQEFEAHVRVVGGLNKINRISPALRDRFDLIYHFKKPSIIESKNISEHLMESHFQKREEKIQGLKEYIDDIQGFEPKISPENFEKGNKMFELYFSGRKKGKSGRWISSAIRIAKALARFHKRDVIPLDFVQSLCMKDPHWASILHRYYASSLPRV